MRQGLVLLVVTLLMVSCGGGRKMSPEELQHKLDSVKALEIKEKLALQGVDLETSDNPMKLFFDSLEIQPLPLSYDEDYVRMLPSYTEDGKDVAEYMVQDSSSSRRTRVTASIRFGSTRWTMTISR